MSKPSRIQAQAAEIEWRRWNDMDTYYPLRDDALAERQNGRPRQYAVRWCIEARQVQKALSEPQIAIAGHCRDLFQAIEKAKGKGATRFDFSDRSFWPEAKHIQFLKAQDEIRELGGFEAVARQLPNGQRCFHGIVEGDSFTAIQARCEVNWRGAVDLICLVTRALELYRGFNEIDAERSRAHVR